MWTSSASSAAAITTKLGRVAEIGDVEAAGMGRAVGADQPGAVDGEADRQILDRDVVDDLVVGALQEGRIDRAERPHPLRGEAGGEGHRMLLGDADVEAAVGEFRAANLSSPVPDGIAAVIAHDLVVARRLGDQRLGEHAGVGRRARRGLGLLAGDDVELLDAVIFVGRGLGRAHSPCPSW